MDVNIGAYLAEQLCSKPTIARPDVGNCSGRWAYGALNEADKKVGSGNFPRVSARAWTNFRKIHTSKLP
jgi:hypothetical protein